jgi:cysteine desulfurase / selenocysteine lyase
MSTSDPGDRDASFTEAWDAMSAAMAVSMKGLPDPAVLARMADELFAAPPGAPLPGPASFAGAPLPGPEAAAPAVPSTEADLYALLASFAAPYAPGLASPPASFGVPSASFGMPAALPGVSQPASFYFLEEARPLVASTPASDTRALVPEIVPVPDMRLVRRPFDPRAVRRDFPILAERVNGRPLVWLDNAATTQKPRSVIERLSRFYEHESSNVHRAAHTLAARSTDAYEAAREKVRAFLNAPSTREIVFVRGATEGINLVAQTWGRRFVEQGDEIVITWIEHHSNIVPWQLLAAEKGARLRVAPVDDRGQIMLDEYEKLFGPRTRLASIAHVSNALGTVLPVREMIEIAHRHGARVLVDGAQAVSHLAVDVQALDSDFYVFSGHKVFGPTGIGVVRGKEELLNASPPWQGGGNMIADVTFEKTVYNAAPSRFEAGTGNIADAVGLGAAIDYLNEIGIENVTRYEHDLLAYATDALCGVPGLHLVGTAREKAGVLSFTLDGVRTEDVGAALDREGIAVRAGHHCAQPALRRFGLESTVRPSLALYNTTDDIDVLVAALRRLPRLGG